MDDDKRHILRVDSESLRTTLAEHPRWVQLFIKEVLLKRQPRLIEELIDDPAVRDIIYTKEKARREEKEANRRKAEQERLDKQRRHDAHIANSHYRGDVDFIHEILGWNESSS